MLPENFATLTSEEKVQHFLTIAHKNLSFAEIRLMTNQLDNFVNDKFWKICVHPLNDDITTNQTIIFERIGNGYNVHELVGLLENVQMDLIAQMRREVDSPEVVKKMAFE